MEWRKIAKIPAPGFGTYKIKGEKAKEIFLMAMEVGYRHFDTAAYYGNEVELGEAIRESGIKREEFFITSKIWGDRRGYDGARQGVYESLERLKLSELDLMLIHWPAVAKKDPNWEKINQETWKGLESLVGQGLSSIGLSNFLPHHIDSLLKTAVIKPRVDQIEFHPGHSQNYCLSYLKGKGIAAEAWSPMARLRIAEDSLIRELCEKYGVSPAVLSLAYALARDVIPLPKATSREKMEDNLHALSLKLSLSDIHRLATMPAMGWSGEHPDRDWVVEQGIDLGPLR